VTAQRMASQLVNKTLEFGDLLEPQVRATAGALRRWVWGWLLSGGRFAVNGHVKRRAYIRRHKMWEYARGLALTGASAPMRQAGRQLNVLDVGGAMTATVFYLAGLGDRVLSLDIDADLAERTNREASARGLALQARTTDLSIEDAAASDLGFGAGFDRIYCFCVIEHVPPPGQRLLAQRLGRMLAPGGMMCLTFDYGEDAPTEAPLRRPGDVEALRDAVGLPLWGNDSFVDTGSRYALNKRHPSMRYTFGSLFFQKP
jgi:SAM-dependent methyltransferase